MATQFGILFCVFPVQWIKMTRPRNRVRIIYTVHLKTPRRYSEFSFSWKWNPIASYCLYLPIPSATKDAYMYSTAFFSLACNLTCFMVAFTCHWTFNTTKKSPVIYFRLDHVCIILHMWATSHSVLFGDHRLGQIRFWRFWNHTGWPHNLYMLSRSAA